MRMARCMVRPRVARGFVGARFFGLAPMYQASKWSSCAPDHHGYPRAFDLIRVNASMGQTCHQGSDAPGRPFLHLFRYLSQTSAGKGLAADHAMSPHLVQFLCSNWRPFLRPDLAVSSCDARRLRQGWPVRATQRAWS